MRLYTEKEAGKILGLSARTMRNWRQKGKGPAYLRLGASEKAPVRYSDGDLLEYISGLPRSRPWRS